ncbi:Cysteine desulfurase [compost metagenome]
MEKFVYVDHSATTYVKSEVLKEMMPYFSENYGNASSVYGIGRVSREAVDKSRDKVASALNCKASEIYFTAGGSEADNLVIMGIARANRKKGNHIITTKIEHLAVLNTYAKLEEEGFEITYLDVNEYGLVNINDIQKAIKSTTILISVMFANNEIGTIQPIEEIGKIAKFKDVYFHTDAVQAIGNIKIDVQSMNIDALSLAAHKFYGPKGIGAAYIRKGINFQPVIFGGHQENNKRAGTENVPGIVGLGKAIEIANENIDSYNNKLNELRVYALKKISQKIDNIKLNGHPEKRLPGNINISIQGVEGESLLLMLDMSNIYASSGSACTSGSLEPSHVLTAIGLKGDYLKGSLRITFGDQNTVEEVDYIVDKLAEIVEKLRKKV